MFDVEHRIALQAVQLNQASSRGEGEVSWIFSSCGRNLGFFLELQQGWPLSICVCSLMSGVLYICEGHLAIHYEAWQGSRDASRGEAGDPVSLFICHRDIGIPINFKKNQTSSPFEALNSTFLSSCQRDVRPLVEMRQESRAFPRVSPGDSVIPSCCEKCLKSSQFREIRTYFEPGYLDVHST